ncbi:MAG: hypothetical protein KTR27_06010 [Leptolyngbyaceae cyanobacterium MAG.088]|nr:hypothetical protein [Leptolyngbyaceae cyanobacterium MAG.088]
MILSTWKVYSLLTLTVFGVFWGTPHTTFAAPAMAQQVADAEVLPDVIDGMEVGMTYASARALIDQEIWAPRTYPPANYVSLAVQQMRDLGYEEVRDCAGTGLGLCRMEFIEREGLVLVIIVTTSEEEPKVWDWSLE